ncbi:SusC/RagA family TonB-linked outer membrane protein [Parabacteroides sp. AM58-2XD]|uniref:SusC/RagA family TonB-linked outer membrane protein n=1 Tax=Parabacteroides sp. AM58-2XD TaxID=2292362 RepID=UPI002103ADB3|nr:SusC/RagA family TonB-linked outer membrane protein [Parabacteroides sp. AM58-2XD]
MQKHFNTQQFWVAEFLRFILNKIPRVMKLSVFLLLCSIGLAQATDSYAQKATVILEMRNQTVKEVLDEIEEQSDFSFFFNIKHVDLNRRVSVVAKKSDIFKVLETVFAGTDVHYSVVDKKIILSTEKQESLIVQQKGKTITGVVKDQNGDPVIGANVIEKGTTNGVITDIDGKFSLTVSNKATIQVSYIGYLGQEVTVGDRTDLTIALKENSQELDEVVVVGYGVQKKVNLTGAVASVSSKDLAERPQPNVQNMIQGKVTGLQIVTNTGQPGRDSGSILIRGKGSFGADSAPLILVDGVVGEFSALSPDDIESISVLKDAASASIYGARAANGVILVTTKKGKAGKAQISYSFNYGWQQATKLGDQIWDSATYMEMYNQMADRMGGRTKYSQEMIDRYKDPNRNKLLYPDYNWMEETFKTGHTMSHNVGINGGTEKVTYNVSLGYLDQEGLLPNHDYRRLTGLMNLEAQVHDRIKIGQRLNFIMER